MIKRIDYLDQNAVSHACSVLKNGGVIVYPTDTLYGFGCDAKNENAIQKINSIKGRKSPMSVLAPNQETVLNWMNVPDSDRHLIIEKLGGASTVIVPVEDGIVSETIMGENKTLGIRMPDHDFCRELSNKYPNPITTTSVNRTGQPAMTDPEKSISEFGDDIDLIIDDGIIAGTGSMIYLYDKGDLKILRL